MGHVDALGVAAVVGAVALPAAQAPPGPAPAGRRWRRPGILAKLVPLRGAADVGAAERPAGAVPHRRPGPHRRGGAAGGWLATGGVPPGLVTYGVSWEFNGPLFEPLWRLLDAAGAAPALARGVDQLKSLTGIYQGLNPVYPYLYPQFLAKLLLAAGMAAAVALSLRERDPVAGTGRLFGRLLLLSATVYPWYLLWVLPWAALRRDAAWLALSGLILLSYLPQLAGVPLMPWVYLGIWGPFFGCSSSSPPLPVRAGGNAHLPPHPRLPRHAPTPAGSARRTPSACSRCVEEALERLLGRPVADRGGEPHRRRGPRPRPGGAPGAARSRSRSAGWSTAPTTTCPRTCGCSPPPPCPPGSTPASTPRGKEYLYRLSRAAVLSPLDSPFVAPAPAAIDLERMAQAAALLPGRHDFSAFALAGGSHRQPFRRIFSAALGRERGGAALPGRRRRVPARHGSCFGGNADRGRRRQAVRRELRGAARRPAARRRRARRRPPTVSCCEQVLYPAEWRAEGDPAIRPATDEPPVIT